MYPPRAPVECRVPARAGRLRKMHYSSSKDCQTFIRCLVKAGWRFSRGGKHNKLYSPSGRLLVISRSPSDWRTLHNLRAECRRLEPYR